MTPLRTGPESFQIGYALLELCHTHEDRTAGAAPPSRLPELDAPIQERGPDRGRGEAASRLHPPSGHPSGVIRNTLEGEARGVEGGPVAHDARHSFGLGASQDATVRHIPLSTEWI